MSDEGPGDLPITGDTPESPMIPISDAPAPAPSPSPVRPKTKMGSYASAMGAQPPLGFFDPLGLLKDADQARFDRLRKVELKHGRISMLAILGHLVTTAGTRFPGSIAFGVPFSKIRTGLAAFEDIPAVGLLQIILFIGVMEYNFNGKYGKDLAQWCIDRKTPFSDERRQTVELNNGRAAQMGILALMVHEKLDNNPYIINSLFGAPIAFNAGI